MLRIRGDGQTTAKLNALDEVEYDTPNEGAVLGYNATTQQFEVLVDRPTADDRIIFKDGKWQADLYPGISVGTTQKYVDVTSERQLRTTYYNLSKKPIYVVVTFSIANEVVGVNPNFPESYGLFYIDALNSVSGSRPYESSAETRPVALVTCGKHVGQTLIPVSATAYRVATTVEVPCPTATAGIIPPGQFYFLDGSNSNVVIQNCVELR